MFQDPIKAGPLRDADRALMLSPLTAARVALFCAQKLIASACELIRLPSYTLNCAATAPSATASVQSVSVCVCMLGMAGMTAAGRGRGSIYAQGVHLACFVQA